jgi:hypothetical protein
MKSKIGLLGATVVAITPDSLYQLIQSGDLTLAFDTSVTARKGFFTLCELANRVNQRRVWLGLPGRITLCVPAAAHTERLFDLAQQWGEGYNLELLRDQLNQRNVQIFPFISEDAEHCAELLARRYATPSAWQDFKKRRCLDCVGLPPKYHKHAVGTGQHCGAPNDWLIIAQASRANMVLVMDDKGRSGEFDLVERKVNADEIRATLNQILGELQTVIDGRSA